MSNVKQFLRIDANLVELASVRGFIERTAHEFEVQDEALSDIRLAVDELVTNTILHGYNGAEGRIDIELQFESGTGDFIVILRDQAPIFDPFSNVPQHSVGEKLAQVKAGGYGLQLVQKAMTKSFHSVTESGGNQLTLIRHL